MDVLDNHSISGDGIYTDKVIEFLKRKYSIMNILMTTSCSQSLEMAIRLAKVKEGDEVILPSFSFTSCANSILAVNAKPVFARVEKETLNIDINSIKRLITDQTKAIMVIHYGGISANIDEIMKIAKEHNIKVIEDAAHAIGAFSNGRTLGSIGDFGSISFHSTKNITSGEGGAIYINSEGIDKNNADIMHQKGTNRFEFLNGNTEKYVWKGYGSSFCPSEILMAHLYAQLEDVEKVTEERLKIVKIYNKLVEEFKDILFSYTKFNTESNGHLFYIFFKDLDKANKFKKYVNNKNIDVRTHYVPLHSTEFGKKYKNDFLNYHLEDDIDKKLMRLPLYPALTDSEIEYICKEIRNGFIYCNTSL